MELPGFQCETAVVPNMYFLIAAGLTSASQTFAGGALIRTDCLATSPLLMAVDHPLSLWAACPFTTACDTAQRAAPRPPSRRRGGGAGGRLPSVVRVSYGSRQSDRAPVAAGGARRRRAVLGPRRPRAALGADVGPRLRVDVSDV